MRAQPRRGIVARNPRLATLARPTSPAAKAPATVSGAPRHARKTTSATSLPPAKEIIAARQRLGKCASLAALPLATARRTPEPGACQSLAEPAASAPPEPCPDLRIRPWNAEHILVFLRV